VLTFPQNLRGLGWPVSRTSDWDGEKQKAQSGKMVLWSAYSFPLWHWQLTFNYLKDIPGDANGAYNPITDLQKIVGFYNQNGGPYGGIFWFNDLNDNTATAEPLGIGDGATTQWQLLRTYGGFTEPVQAPQTWTIYLNGVAQGSGFTVSPTGLVTFTAAPGAGVEISWTGTYFWNVHFEDGTDQEEWMYQIWRLKTCKLEMFKF
jgi:hypothetical protein